MMQELLGYNACVDEWEEIEGLDASAVWPARLDAWVGFFVMFLINKGMIAMHGQNVDADMQERPLRVSME